MTELVILRAEDDAALVREARRIIGYLDRVGSTSLLDVAYSCMFTEGNSVLALVADSTEDLRARLASATDRIEQGSAARIKDKSGTYWFREHLLGEGKGKLAFVYPGVMAFYPDMLRDLSITHPECRGAFDEMEEALKEVDKEFSPANFIFPPAPRYRHDADIFKSGAYAQALVATYAACSAADRMLQENGVEPDGLVGFAGGDLASMVKSGAVGKKFGREERMEMIRDIYRIINKAVTHGGMPETPMVSVLLRHGEDAEKIIAAVPAGAITLAIDFSPRQKTYAIAKEHEDAVMAAFASLGVRAVKLALNRPFNTPACAGMVPAIRKFTDRWVKDSPLKMAYSCALSAPVPERVRKLRGEIAERWTKPVRFGETVAKMHEDGYRVFLEVGPRGLMTTAIDDTLKGKEYAAVAINSIHRSGRLQVQHAMALLAALGCPVDVYKTFTRRGARKVDFDSAFAVQTRRDSEMRLSRAFPRMTLPDDFRQQASSMGELSGRGAKAAQRAAVQAAKERRQRQFEHGTINPLVSDSEVLAFSPGVSIELRKVFKVSDAPFINDFAFGNNQVSYSDPSLRGLVLMSIPLAVEIMAEVATMVAQAKVPVAVDGFVSRRHEAFAHGEFPALIRAERKACAESGRLAVRVQMFRSDEKESGFTSPSMEATILLASEMPPEIPVKVEQLARPRTVHWSGRDIYPLRLCFGPHLRGIRAAEQWSETGVDYEVEVPRLAGCVALTPFPSWKVNPLLLEIVVSGYSLWRSHERFAGSYSFPFKMRRLDLLAPLPKEGSKVKCYLRLTGVTPNTLVCDIAVSDGNGSALMTVAGWEEYVEYVNSEYRTFIMQPTTSFLTRPLSDDTLGPHLGIDVSSAYVTDIPYPVFERNGEIWFKTFVNIALARREREEASAMTGSLARRLEWLFGRIAAKEAVRRYLKDYYQARWAYADVVIYAGDQGKPNAIGEWQDHLEGKIDITIAHTAHFVVALASSGARVGVDVESVGRDLSEEFTAGVFTPEELEIAAGSSNPTHAIIKFWCAKEAVSKALGTGIRYSPKELTVKDFDVDSGVVQMRLEGAWADAFRNLKGRNLPVAVRETQGHALAFCFIAASLFQS